MMATAEAIELLVPLEVYVSAGLHVGTHVKAKAMMPFIYKARPDGLYILDVRKADERIRVAAKFLSRFDPPKMVVVSSRQYGQQPVEKFCQLVGAHPLVGRFSPGTFTNPKLVYYTEPDVLMVTDPRADSQAVIEASVTGVPVVAFCDTDSKGSFVDLIIPANNKGRKALALLYWLLARQILRERGELAADAELSVTVEEFEAR